MSKQSVWHCYLCGAKLDADNVYGEEGMDLCRDDHDKFWQLVKFMLDPSRVSPLDDPLQPLRFLPGEEEAQLSLFQPADAGGSEGEG